MKVVSDSISGYLNSLDSQRRIECNREYTWNYVEIGGEYYLIDVSIVSDFRNNDWPDYFYLFFGTEPEIFIRLHFPKESKWQLLSEPYTFEKYESMALLYPFFYLLGFKNISPDTTILTGSGEIILTSDKPIPEIDFSIYSCIKEPVDETTT